MRVRNVRGGVVAGCLVLAIVPPSPAGPAPSPTVFDRAGEKSADAAAAKRSEAQTIAALRAKVKLGSRPFIAGTNVFS
jgi:hypothetical protein